MADTAGELVRLTQFRVTGLFGEFNHRIDFNQNDRVTALIGPNGLGKTACLRLINALFRKQWSVFSSTDFTEVEYVFSNGNTVTVSHINTTDSDTEVSDALGIRLRTRLASADEGEIWSPRVVEEAPGRLGRIDGYLPYVTRTGPRMWTRGGSVCLHRLAARISGLPLVDHAAARSGWLKYIWSGVLPPSAECGRTAL